MKCPIDGAELIAERAEDHTGYGCLICKSSWLPKSYIDSIKYSKDFQPIKFYNDLCSEASDKTDNRCPSNCGTLNLVKTIEGLSYCPSCYGVWFKKDALKSMLKCYRDKESSMVSVDSPNITVGIFDLLGSLFK